MGFIRLAAGGSIIALLSFQANAQEAEEAETTRDGSQIVVTATRGEAELEQVPVSIVVRDVEELRSQGFIYGTDEFRGVPGVFFRRGEGDGDLFPFVSIRGSTGTDGYLALVDGVPFVGFLEEPLVTDVPYDAIDTIEIVKGPSSALYGRGALYGAVNYITKTPTENAVRGTLQAGSDDYFRGALTVSQTLGDRGGLLVGGAYEDFEGWREQSAREVLNLFGKLNYDLSDDTRLSVFGSYIDRDVEVPNGLPVTPDGNVLGDPVPFLGFGDPRALLEGFIGAVRLEQGLADNITLTVTGQHRRFDRESFLNFYDVFGADLENGIFGVNGFRDTADQRVWFGEATLAGEFGSHKIIAGASYEDTNVSTFNRWSGQNGFTFECGFTFYLAQIDIETGAVVNRDNPCFVLDEPLTDATFDDRVFGFFIQDEIALTDRLTLTLGGRYDNFRRSTNFAAIPGTSPGGQAELEADAFSPKAAISYRTDFGLIYASYGRGFNSNFGPPFENDPARFARPVQEPSTLDSIEIGVKGRALDDTIRFEAAAYRTWQDNRRINVPNPDAAGGNFDVPPRLLTFGQEIIVTGFESSVDIQPRDGTLIRLQYSHIDAEWEELVLSGFGGPQDFSGAAPVGVAPNIVFLSAEQRIFPWLAARGSFEFYDDYAVTVNNNLFAGGYELATLGASIDPPGLDGIGLDIAVTNLFDNEYFFFFGGTSTPTYATPGPPRQVRATVRAAF